MLPFALVLLYLEWFSVAVDYSTVSMVWTPQSTKLCKQNIKKMSQRHKKLPYNKHHQKKKKKKKKRCICQELSSTQNKLCAKEESESTLLIHCPFFRMPTQARKHHLVVCLDIAVCG